tara:strand:- start:771 stop:1094 length:324 start_codon:yes stop_codon:yes gene_type:complete
MAKDIKKRGRPLGMRATQLDIQRKLYEHPDREKVIETIYRAALDDDHKNQAVAMKLIMDRALPISLCDKKLSDIRPHVNITVTGIKPRGGGEVLDAEPINDEDFTEC